MILFLATPRAGDENHRYLIPTDQAWSDDEINTISRKAKEVVEDATVGPKLLDDDKIIVHSKVLQKNGEREGTEFLVLQDIRIRFLSKDMKEEFRTLLNELFKTSQQKIEEFNRDTSISFPWETMTKNTDLSFHWTHLDETFNSIGDILNSADLAETTSQSTIAKTTGRNRIFTMPRFIILLVLGLIPYLADYYANNKKPIHKPSKSSSSNSNINCYKKILYYFPEYWVAGNNLDFSNVNDETKLADLVLKNLEELLGNKYQITTSQKAESKIKEILLVICDITGSPQDPNITLQNLVPSDNPPTELDKIFPKRKHDIKGLITQKEGDLANLPFEDLKRLREIHNKLVKLREDIKKIGSIIDESDALTNPQENILKKIENYKLHELFEYTGFRAYTVSDTKIYETIRDFINDLMKSIEAYDKNYKRSGNSFVKDFASAPLKEDNAKENSKATACWNQLVAIHKEFKKFQEINISSNIEP